MPYLLVSGVDRMGYRLVRDEPDRPIVLDPTGNLIRELAAVSAGGGIPIDIDKHNVERVKDIVGVACVSVRVFDI
jgi:hypothetical protein